MDKIKNETKIGNQLSKEEKASLKSRLTSMQYFVTQENGTEPPFKMSMINILKRESMLISSLENRYLHLAISLMQDVAGRHSPDRLRQKRSQSMMISLMDITEQRYGAVVRIPI